MSCPLNRTPSLPVAVSFLTIVGAKNSMVAPGGVDIANPFASAVHVLLAITIPFCCALVISTADPVVLP